MAENYDYDFVIIGGGSAGTTAAMTAVNYEKRTLLVEKGPLGGTCTNVGCVPSKSYLHAAALYRAAETARDRGIISQVTKAEFDPVKKQREALIKAMRNSGEMSLKSAGVELLTGRATITGPNSIAVADKNITFNNILIATGGAPFIPPIEGLADVPYLTSTTALELERLPRSIVIVGGAYIGLEFASFFHSFGVDVTIVEALDRLAPTEDRRVSEYLEKILTAKGITISLNTMINEIRQESDALRLTAERGGSEVSFSGEKVLIATGRAADLSNLGLKNAGVDYDRKGIKVDNYLRSSVNNILAAGDVVPPPSLQLEHVAVYEGWLAANNIFSSNQTETDYRVIPRVIFTNPEIASVGETEEQAAGRTRIITAVYPYAGIPRAQIDDDTDGFIKLVADADSGLLSGAHIIGTNAGELIHLAALAMHGQIPIPEIAVSIAAYPTLSQGFYYACETLANKLQNA